MLAVHILEFKPHLKLGCYITELLYGTVFAKPKSIRLDTDTSTNTYTYIYLRLHLISNRLEQAANMALSPLSLTGFTKSTNLVLFLLLPCTFALFSLSNLPALARGNWVYWHVPRAPGEKIWFQDGTIRMIAMQVHMWSVIRTSPPLIPSLLLKNLS